PQRYHVNSHVYRLMEGPTRFQRMVALDRIEPDARAIEIVMTGGGGDWRFTIPIEAQSASGARAMRTDAIDVHHGIAIEAPLVARSERITAIELQAYFLDHADAADGIKRTIEGISCLSHTRGLGQDLLMLRDSTGAHHLERPRGVQDPAGRGRRREVAIFEPMPADAVSASFEIPY